MCDTLYMERDEKVYFGKNSDRSPNEAHLMVRKRAKDYPAGATLKATYISLPQIQHTHACVLLKPHWIWGAEMGWNEYGLNIGNEALFTKGKYEKTGGLLGMDMLRLALERCKTAREALQFLIFLLETYGQGGNCAFDKNFYYDNAFLIADGKDAFVLETAGKAWAYKRASETETISNCFSLRENYDKASSGVSGDFRKQNQNNLFTAVAGADTRKAHSHAVLNESGSPFALIMKALKSHENEQVDIHKSSTKSVCMHAGNLFGDQTTGSYCGEINKLYFVTGCSFPCLSVFKPLSPQALALPEHEDEALQYWLRQELLHRHLMSGNLDKSAYLKKAEKLQAEFLRLALNATADELDDLSQDCFKAEAEFISACLEEAKGKKLDIRGGAYFRRYWNQKTEVLLREYGL